MLEASGQIVLLEPWFSNRTKSIVKSPKLYLADTGLLCALLNIRSEEALRQSPAVGAVWETFVLPSFGTANAAEGAQAASSSGATEPAKWTLWWIRQATDS
jgi:hypothetical protein